MPMRLTLLAIAAVLAASCSGSNTGPSVTTNTPAPLPPNVTVTPIPTPAPPPAVFRGPNFDQTFWNAFVHDGYEHPQELIALQRWTAAPSVYLRTIDDTGRAIDSATLNATAQALKDVAAQWTGGLFGIAGVTQGTETRVGAHGWITVTWNSKATSYCGLADVASDGGTIELAPKTPNCGCPPSVSTVTVRPRTVKHELGHAFGYWHTGNAADLMSGLAVSECDREPSERERYHAEIAYRSPVGTVTALPIGGVRSIVID